MSTTKTKRPAGVTPAPRPAPDPVDHSGWQRIRDQTQAHLWRNEGAKANGYREAVCGARTAYSLAPHLGHGFCRACEVWVRSQPAPTSTPAVAGEIVEAAPAPAAGALSAQLQDIARNYVAARRKTGEGLLESASWMAAARAAAAHGEWGLFLAATGTSEGTAKRLIDIHEEAERTPAYRQKILDGWLGASVAALIAQSESPAAVLARLLEERLDPPGVADVQAARADVGDKSAKLADLPAAQPSPGAEALATLRGAGWTVDQVGAGWLAKHADYDQLLVADTPNQLLAQMKRKGVPVAPAPAPKVLTCKACGLTPAPELLSDRCPGCYMLKQAQQWGAGSDEARWRLVEARTAAERDPDEGRRRGRLAEVADVAAAMGVSLDGEAPAPAPAPAPSFPPPGWDAARDRAHAVGARLWHNESDGTYTLSERAGHVPRISWHEVEARLEALEAGRSPRAPAPAGPPRCWDCGTREDVVAVEGAVGHLCRPCRAKRGARITDGLSPAAIAAGWAYKHNGAMIALEEGGEFRGWVRRQDGDPEYIHESAAAVAVLQGRAVAEIEARVAPPVPPALADITARIDAARALLADGGLAALGTDLDRITAAIARAKREIGQEAATGLLADVADLRRALETARALPARHPATLPDPSVDLMDLIARVEAVGGNLKCYAHGYQLIEPGTPTDALRTSSYANGEEAKLAERVAFLEARRAMDLRHARGLARVPYDGVEVPPEWDAWRARAQALGGTLTQAINGGISWVHDGRMVQRHGPDGWREICEGIAAAEAAQAPAPVVAAPAPAAPVEEEPDIDPRDWVEVADECGPTVMVRAVGLPPVVAEAAAQVADALRLVCLGEAHQVDTELLHDLARVVEGTPGPGASLLRTMLRMAADAADEAARRAVGVAS